MSELLVIAANDLTKREHPKLVAATGLLFERLGELYDKQSLRSLASNRGGTWGEESVPGLGYPVLRSTNMRGTRVDVTDATRREVPPRHVEACALESGDILVTKSSGSSDLVGKAALFIHPGDNETYLFSNFTLRLRPDQTKILPEFLAWFLRSPQSLAWRYEAQHTTVGLRNLKTRDFLKQLIPVPDLATQEAVMAYLDALEAGDGTAMNVPLPPSLEEQRRIVARIEELAAKVEAARALRVSADRQLEALFASAVNEVWQNQSGWTVKPVREMASTVSGQVDPKVDPYASLPHVNGEVMESGTCRLLHTYRLAKEDGVTSGKYHFKAGMILYSKIRPYLKKAVQVPFEGICSADVYVFEWIDPAVEPRFFMYSLISPRFTEYANARSGRTRIPKLNQKQLFAFKMTYPSLSEQHRIVAYLDALQAKVDAVKQHQAATTAALDALLPSILDRAFKGEL